MNLEEKALCIPSRLETRGLGNGFGRKNKLRCDFIKGQKSSGNIENLKKSLTGGSENSGNVGVKLLFR